MGGNIMCIKIKNRNKKYKIIQYNRLVIYIAVIEVSYIMCRYLNGISCNIQLYGCI